MEPTPAPASTVDDACVSIGDKCLTKKKEYGECQRSPLSLRLLICVAVECGPTKSVVIDECSKETVGEACSLEEERTGICQFSGDLTICAPPYKCAEKEECKTEDGRRGVCRLTPYGTFCDVETRSFQVNDRSLAVDDEEADQGLSSGLIAMGALLVCTNALWCLAIGAIMVRMSHKQ